MEKEKNNGSQFNAPPRERQMLDKKAEEYLREGGNIEDMPNTSEEQEEENLMKLVNEKKEQREIDQEQVKSERKDN